MGSQTRSRRIPELDALRGLAAVAVLLGHWMTVVPAWVADTRNLPGYGLLNLFKYTPLSVFTAAYEAVLVFFVLSGFVLALPFLEGRGGSYRSFLVRRAFRIYPVAWVAAGAAMAAVAILGTHALPERDGVVGLSWQAMPTPALLLGHGTLLTRFDANAFDPPLWSL